MSTSARPAPTLQQVCAAEGFRLLQRFPEPSPATEFVARVSDATGKHLLLKRGTGLRGSAEAQVLQAFGRSGFVPGGVRILGELTFVSEWFDGAPLDPRVAGVGELLPSLGAALRAMHASPLPSLKLMPISRRTSADWIARDLGEELSPRLMDIAHTAAAELGDCVPADRVLLHGDAVPQNIIVSPSRRICFIDPIGFVGPAGWDVAQLAIAIPGRDRRATLAELVAGYGGLPPRLEAAFAYLVLVFLAKHLEMERANPGSQGRVVGELEALAGSL